MNKQKTPPTLPEDDKEYAYLLNIPPADKAKVLTMQEVHEQDTLADYFRKLYREDYKRYQRRQQRQQVRS